MPKNHIGAVRSGIRPIALLATNLIDFFSVSLYYLLMTPIFCSQYSIGKAILTLEPPFVPTKDQPEKPTTGADSIFDIAKENNLKEIFLLDNSFAGFGQFYESAQTAKVQPRFGIKLTCCENAAMKDADSLLTEYQIALWALDYTGYQKLLDLYSEAATTNFYYRPRIDEALLKKHWHKDHIKVTFPFYSSFLSENLLHFKKCLFTSDKIKPIFFVENNSLPFDSMIEERVREYAKSSGAEVELVKTIYYKERKDWPAYCTFRCIDNRTTLQKPNIDHFASAEFCWESYLEETKI